MKRLFTLMFVLIFIITGCSKPANPDTSTSENTEARNSPIGTSEHFTYYIDNGEITLLSCKYDENCEGFIIPEEIDGMPVSKLSSQFITLSKIKKLETRSLKTFPTSMIGYDKLEALIIPSI